MPEILSIRSLGIGHGDATLIQAQVDDSTWTCLVDGGKSTKALTERLREYEIKHLDLLILSHFDFDHIGGLVGLNGHVSVDTYWGPALSAFDRHFWLFGEKTRGPFERAQVLEAELSQTGTHIIYPVEGYQSAPMSFNGPEIQVLSPPSRLIRELFTNDRVHSLEAGDDMPMGWLLQPPPPVAEQPGDLDLLDAAFARGYLERTDISTRLSRQLEATSARTPEFFGDKIVNNTSLVIWLGMRTGGKHHSILLTGDLENWTYLLARYPRGLHADIMKASHHGGNVKLEKKIAHDEVLSQVRPKAVMISACGEHELPHSTFRDAALRWGSAVFCTSERGLERMAGTEEAKKCCCDEFQCNRDTRTVEILCDVEGIHSTTVACHSGLGGQPGPIIQIEQHLVEPSRIVSRLFEQELAGHIRWVRRQLEKLHEQRMGQDLPDKSGSDPITAETILNLADRTRRQRLAPHINTVLSEGAKRGVFWRNTTRSGNDDAMAYMAPSTKELAQIADFLEKKAVLVFDGAFEGTIDEAMSLDRETILNRLLTHGVAIHINMGFAFPHAICRECIWPHLVSRFRKKPWHGYVNTNDRGAGSFKRNDGAIAIARCDETTECRDVLFGAINYDVETGQYLDHQDYDWRSDPILAYMREGDRYDVAVKPAWCRNEISQVASKWLHWKSYVSSYSNRESIVAQSQRKLDSGEVRKLW